MVTEMGFASAADCCLHAKILAMGNQCCDSPSPTSRARDHSHNEIHHALQGMARDHIRDAIHHAQNAGPGTHPQCNSPCPTSRARNTPTMQFTMPYKQGQEHAHSKTERGGKMDQGKVLFLELFTHQHVFITCICLYLQYK